MTFTNVFFVMVKKKIGEPKANYIHTMEYYSAIKKNEREVDFCMQTWEDVYGQTGKYKERDAKQQVQCHPINV